MLYQRTLITRYSVGFQNIGAAILADTITFTIRDLTGTTFQWLVKENITDLDAEALAGNFGNITSTSKDITFTLGSNFNVGDTYYFALREFDGITSQEVIQVSFTISQNAILGSGTSILVLPPEGVGSVNGETGDVVLTQDDVLNGTTNVQFSSANKTTYDNHISSTANPHNVTKAQLGLGNVDNTSDLDKPLSTVTKNYVDNPFEWTPANYGYLSWNYDPATINNTTALVNGTAVGIKLRIPRAVTITNIIINVNSGGGLDNCFVALYQDNALLAQSANQTDWNVGGNKVIPLSSPQAVEAGTVDKLKREYLIIKLEGQNLRNND
jgi:hypothetical protein